MSHARTGSNFVRGLEAQVAAMVAETSQEAMAGVLGLASHAQVSRRLERVHAGSAHVEAFSAVDLVYLARAHAGVRRALIDATVALERPADGSRVTADLRALLSAMTAATAAEARALEDELLSDQELVDMVHQLPAVRERLDRFEAGALARLAARTGVARGR